MDEKEVLHFVASTLADDVLEGPDSIVLMLSGAAGGLALELPLRIVDQLIASLPAAAADARRQPRHTTQQHAGVGMSRSDGTVVLVIQIGRDTPANGIVEFAMPPARARAFADDIRTAADALEARPN